ncbi:MAG: Ni/Fe hydrogenase subunit alpha, partial [Gammaproteobacteria bacterium]|nr:Ni/Fe hydrogenase subunit alpha [Gammaproteobacteria bacterium]
PTSQNQARIEEDLKLSLESLGLDQAEETIRFQAEQIIRNYDPCISCATHFLDLRINRQ